MIFKKFFIADSGSATLKTPFKMPSPTIFFWGVMIFKKIFIPYFGSGARKNPFKMYLYFLTPPPGWAYSRLGTHISHGQYIPVYLYRISIEIPM